MTWWHPNLTPLEPYPPERKLCSLQLPWHQTRDFWVPRYVLLVPPGELVEYSGRWEDRLRTETEHEAAR